MKRTTLFLAVVIFLVAPKAANARQADPKTPGGAFVRSLLLPGLGHRYTNGRWGASGTTFALADAALWTGLFGVTWRRSNLEDSYRALAVSRAGADMDGKNRTFVLRLASYRSSDEFVEVALRNRAWEDIGYVDDPSYRWNWETEEDFLQFRDLRNDAESLGRRRTLIVASLVANRILAGILSTRAVRRAADMSVSMRPSMDGSSPVVDLGLRF